MAGDKQGMWEGSRGPHSVFIISGEPDANAATAGDAEGPVPYSARDEGLF